MKISLYFIIIVLIISSCGNNRILEKNYELDYNPNWEINLVISNNGYSITKVPGHILFYGHNKEYILINQKSANRIYSEDENHTYQARMEKIFKTKFSEYYIITLSNDKIYGPLNKRMYISLREKLDIPKNIKLDNSTLKFFTKGKRKDIEYSDIDSLTIDVKNLKGNQFN